MTEFSKFDPDRIKDILKHNSATSDLYKELEKKPMLFSQGLAKAFAAAVTDASFRKKFVENPLEALEGEYLGETFEISDDESEIFEFISAESLHDLAIVLTYLRKNSV